MSAGFVAGCPLLPNTPDGKRETGRRLWPVRHLEVMSAIICKEEAGKWGRARITDGLKRARLGDSNGENEIWTDCSCSTLQYHYCKHFMDITHIEAVSKQTLPLLF